MLWDSRTKRQDTWALSRKQHLLVLALAQRVCIQRPSPECSGALPHVPSVSPRLHVSPIVSPCGNTHSDWVFYVLALQQSRDRMTTEMHVCTQCAQTDCHAA